MGRKREVVSTTPAKEKISCPPGGLCKGMVMRLIAPVYYTEWIGFVSCATLFNPRVKIAKKNDQDSTVYNSMVIVERDVSSNIFKELRPIRINKWKSI